MTLTSALRTATSSIETYAKQAGVTSRNLAGAGEIGYVRRNAQVLSHIGGTTSAVISRQVDAAVVDAANLSKSRLSKWEAISTYMDRFAAYQDIDGFSNSAANMVGRLHDAVELAAASPSDENVLRSLVDTARSISGEISSSYDTILATKAEIDRLINADVTALNDNLNRLQELNRIIVDGTRNGREVFDEMDKRDQIIANISEKIGIKVTGRENNDVLITLTNGVMLFDGKPRSVSFLPTPVYGSSTLGGDIRVDGVPVAGPDTRMLVTSGTLAGLVEVRDNALGQMQVELDEIARSLVEVFSETDQTGGGKPALTGLFVWTGSPAVPPTGTYIPGIAMQLSVNPAVDASTGGDFSLIRDGGINGDADYLSNITGGAGFSDRLLEQLARLDGPVSFVPGTSSTGSVSIASFAAEALSRFNNQRQDAANTQSYFEVLSGSFNETLQNETGVNLDFEMSRLLEIERSYQANAKLIEIVDRMLAALIEAT